MKLNEPRRAELKRRCAPGLADLHVISLVAQFSLGHEAVTTVIPGCKSVAEAERSVATMDVAIPAAFWARLKELKLLPADVPVPE